MLLLQLLLGAKAHRLVAVPQHSSLSCPQVHFGVGMGGMLFSNNLMAQVTL